MASQGQHPTTIAILGPNSVPEYVLMHLLEEREGYTVRLLKAPPGPHAAVLFGELGAESVEALLGEVDVVLVWPSLRESAIEEFMGAMESSPVTASIPILALPSSLEVALQDELAVDAPLKQQFEHLVRGIEATLSAEAS